MSKVLPVILANSSEDRLWPFSRELYPKQYSPLRGERSLLQENMGVALESLLDQSPLLVCNEDHGVLAAQQLRELGMGEATILLEPIGRNTAPALALAALHATREGQDPILLVFAANHVITDIEAFQQSLRHALTLAEEGYLTAFGVVPSNPRTGYSYILPGEPLGENAFRIMQFMEKPSDAETSEKYLVSEDYFWNSGIFMFRASNYLQELKQFQPDMLDACITTMENIEQDMHFLRIDREAFWNCPQDSVNYAVMKKTSRAAMVSLSAGTCDVES